MAFHITIKEVTREQVKTREYKKVGQDPDGESKYDYVTDEKTDDVERTIYTQRVDELDMVSVINAINKEKK